MSRFTNSGISSKLLTLQAEYLEFKRHYDAGSGMDLPIEYFIDRKAYCFYDKSKMIAGFIIGTRKPFRTVDVMVNELDKNEFYSLINEGENCCEVVGFWISKKSLTLWRSIYIWFTMANGVWNAGKDFILGGTKAAGLAKMYGYPRHSALIYTGEVNGKQTWVFKPLRKYVYLSAMEIIVYKLKKTINKSLLQRPTDVVFKAFKGV